MTAITPQLRVVAPVADRTGRLLAYVVDAESEGLLRRAAAGLLMPHAEVRRGTVRTAIRDLGKQDSPDVLVVDLTGVHLTTGAMEELAQVCEPSVRVIAIGDRNDISLYRDLRALGVAEYLFKPLPADQIEQALTRVMSGRSTENHGRQGKLIAVTGARGGTGTTTIAINLAAHLARTGRYIALVDLDLHGGTIALTLNLKPGQALREAIETPDRVDAVFLERAMTTAADRLDVLASEEPLGDRLAFHPEPVLALLNQLQNLYHYIVIDMPQGLTIPAWPILDAASVRVVVADGSLASARDANRLRTIFEETAEKKRTLVVLNHAGAPGSLKSGDFATALGTRPDLAIDHLPKPLGVAATFGELAITRNRTFRNAIGRLAQSITGQAAAPRTGLFGRIFAR
jgi:pilus assembly protein CpaE